MAFRQFCVRALEIILKALEKSLIDPAAVSRGFEDGLAGSSCDSAVRSVGLKPGSLYEFALASAQGSGSKWVLHLVDLATGVQSFLDAVAVLTPRYGAGAGLFVKTHHQRLQHAEERRLREEAGWRTANLERFGRRGVLLLRNPYDAVVSHWTHRRAGSEVDTAEDLFASLRTQEFRDFADLEMKIWLDIAYDWLSVCPYLLVVHYENFLEDPVREIRKILKFLKFAENEKRLKCLGQRPVEYFKRKYRPAIPTSVFPESLRAKMDAGIESVQAMLAAKGFEEIPVEKYSHTCIKAVSLRLQKKAHSADV